MKKKIIVSAVSVGLALAVIGASVGVYMSYINKYEPIASPTALAYTKSDSQNGGTLITMGDETTVEHIYVEKLRIKK